MDCEITPLKNNSSKFYELEYLTQQSRGWSHDPIDIKEIYEIKWESEWENFNNSIGNNRLLWHGGEFFNFGGLLSKGFSMPNNETPPQTYRFGWGIYFSDVATKAASYSHPEISGETGLLLLSKVALGNSLELLSDDFFAYQNIPKY